MANEIKPEDVRRIAAQKEREVFGENAARRFVDPNMDFSAQPPLAPSAALPPLMAEPRSRGPYDRATLRTSPDDRASLKTSPAPLELQVETEDDDDLGLPPSYSATDYGREELYLDEEAPPRRRRRLLPMTVAFLAVLGFAGVVWYAYDWGSGGTTAGKVPIIQASAGEEKVKPANEAGMDVPNQESTVLNPQAEEPKEEVLMPAPEEPVVLITPEPAPQPTPQPEVEEDAVLVLTPAVPPAPPAPSGEGSEQSAGSDTIAEIIAAQGGSQTGSASQSQDAVAAAPAPAPAPAPQQSPAVTPAAAPAIALPAPSPSSQPVIAAGAFLIQLASLTSADAAEQTWARLQKQHAALLGDMAVNIQKADIDGKGTYFRVQAGPLPNRATADDMCAQLKAAQQDCIVVKK